MSSTTRTQKQRTFIHTAFYPDGGLVCSLLGLPPASEEQNGAEDSAAQRLFEHTPMSVFASVVDFSKIFAEGCAALKRDKEPGVEIDPKDAEYLMRLSLYFWRGLMALGEAPQGKVD